MAAAEYFGGVAVDQEDLTVTESPVRATVACELSTEQVAIVGLGMSGRFDVGHDRPVQNGEAGADRIGDRADVIDEVEAVEIRSEYAGASAVTGVDHRIALDQLNESGVCATVSERPAQDEHVATSHPDDISGSRNPHTGWLPKIGFGDVEAERAEVGSFSFDSCPTDIAGRLV